MEAKIDISVLVIVKDEEEMISDCLKSVSWAKEIIVLDTGSIDKTISVSKKLGAKVFEYKGGKNYSDWRNRALQLAKCDWVLYIDADERVTPSLKKEIINVINNHELGAFAIPRRNFVLGKELKHGGWYPDYQKRLYKKTNLIGWRGEVHEEPIFKGNLGHLKESLLHIKHETFAQMVDKTNNWSEIEGKLMFDTNHPPMTISRFVTAMWREFWYRFVIKKAFLDGKIGITFSIYQVFSRFVSYAKLWELQIKSKNL